MGNVQRRLLVVAYGWVLLNLIGLLAWWRWQASEDVSWGFWLTCVLAAFGLGPVLLLQQSQSAAPLPTTPDEEPPEENPPVVDPRNPYRGRLLSAVRAAEAFAAPVARSTSATVLSLVVGGALFTASLLVSSLLHLPAWLEAELVLGLLWVLGVTVFTGMLWRGSRLEDDRHAHGLAWTRGLSVVLPNLSVPERNAGRGCLDLDGVLLVFLVALTFLTSYVFVELLLPVVFLVIYYSLFAGVGHVVNDQHGCQGRPLRAMLWGAAWTTIYLAPIALVVGLLGHGAELLKH